MLKGKGFMSYHEYKAKKEEEKRKEKEVGKLKVEEVGGAKQKKRDKSKGRGVPEKEEVEQHITIMPNPAARRGSMANFAFPELHSKAKLKNEPENLLVLTTTRTDTRGRRHSVAVPLIPPPDGEKFEGGYHIERNPITGGARLVPPPPGSNPVPSSSRSGRRHSIQVTPLTKELEKLKLADKASNGTKPGKKVERRASSRRRSSRQGFLHFLDLAIAN